MCFGVFVIISTDEYDAYIIVSFTNATLVLSIGETVEEITNSGFLGTTPTLAAHQLGEDALLQVCASHELCVVSCDLASCRYTHMGFVTSKLTSVSMSGRHLARSISQNVQLMRDKW